MNLAIISLGGPGGKKIATAASKFFNQVDLISIKDLVVHIQKDGIKVLHGQKELKHYDCIYLRGSFKYALLQRSISEALYGKCYMPLVPSAFTIGHDKFLTSVILKQEGIATPETHLALTTKAAKSLLKKVHYPIIMKIPSGTHGKGVMFADTQSSANTILDTLEVFKQPFIIQEYIETGRSKAEDLRAIVAGNKVIGAMKRTAASDDLRANIHMGGSGEGLTLSYEQEQIAVKAAKALGCDLCAVDILDNGKQAYVIEVNTSPGLKGISTATRKNMGHHVAKFLSDQTKQFLEAKKEVGAKDILAELDADKKEILTNVQIKASRIILPEVVTKVSGFDSDQEVSITADKGKVVVKTVD